MRVVLAYRCEVDASVFLQAGYVVFQVLEAHKHLHLALVGVTGWLAWHTSRSTTVRCSLPPHETLRRHSPCSVTMSTSSTTFGCFNCFKIEISRMAEMGN